VTQGALVEELDAAQRDGEAGPGEVLDVGEVQEVLAEIVLGEAIGGPVEVPGELADSVDVGLLGAGREPAELHVFEHALAKWGDRLRLGRLSRCVYGSAPVVERGGLPRNTT
jgi:hypothetical protein